MKRSFLRLTILALCLVPSAALAHTGIGATSGFMHGFMHPLGGLDHLLAMVLVGIFAYQLGGRALWLVPLTFIAVMALGGFLGVADIPVPFVEIGIALSVIVLGAIVAFGIKAPVAVAMAIAGLFAIFHGHAHGTEMPMDASGALYGAGFIMATALLHAIGIGIGMLIGMMSQTFGKTVYRVAGGVASVAGLALLVGYV
ncbi:urease accessory protein [Methyloceanibacter methanicus]|uniref:Urease accessory protein n=1 Tax=Methyloceanibacter methanicus TaxID=1774968 RepID=A0A1E3W0W0_9HYPH|nr:HupE/UreJ family protein [Methyloceanibacter methanicus]ODR99393.1 urease accessory protein [Methyloceanibacter methanicus]